MKSLLRCHTLARPQAFDVFDLTVAIGCGVGTLGAGEQLIGSPRVGCLAVAVGHRLDRVDNHRDDILRLSLGALSLVVLQAFDQRKLFPRGGEMIKLSLKINLNNPNHTCNKL